MLHQFLYFEQFLKREPGQISFPLDFRHTITVKHTAIRDDPKLRTPPPGSPAIPRYRAIARKQYQNHNFMLFLQNSISIAYFYACFTISAGYYYISSY